MTPRAWLLFGAVSLVWGVPYFFIKVAVDDGVPPGVRGLVAGGPGGHDPAAGGGPAWGAAGAGRPLGRSPPTPPARSRCRSC